MLKLTKWHAHVARITKYTNMVGGPGPGTLAPPKSGVAPFKIYDEFDKKYARTSATAASNLCNERLGVLCVTPGASPIGRHLRVLLIQ